MVSGNCYHEFLPSIPLVLRSAAPAVFDRLESMKSMPVLKAAGLIAWSSNTFFQPINQSESTSNSQRWRAVYSSFTAYAEIRIFEFQHMIEIAPVTTKSRVLFVCMANAARSQLAEALLRHTDSENFEAFSGGITPGAVDPRTVAVLENLGISTQGLRSKSIDEFELSTFDYVITLCDKSISECQSIPISSVRLSWSFDDPVTSKKHEAFRHTLHEIHERIKMFVLVKTKR